MEQPMRHFLKIQNKKGTLIKISKKKKKKRNRIEIGIYLRKKKKKKKLWEGQNCKLSMVSGYSK